MYRLDARHAMMSVCVFTHVVRSHVHAGSRIVSERKVLSLRDRKGLGLA